MVSALRAGEFGFKAALWIAVLVGAFFARGFLLKQKALEDGDFPDVSPRLNRWLATLFLAEARMPWLPFGTSLAALERDLHQALSPPSTTMFWPVT